jgi:bifunctional DNase/RNase
MIEVVISRLGMDPGTQTYVVVLQEKHGTRLLPIWIGQPEAESIVTHMHDIKRPRPLTHDLCRSIITALGATLRRVQITRVENNTYFGELHLERAGAIVQVDSRPSDALAIAIRLNAPIFAADALLIEPQDDEAEQGNEGFLAPDAGTNSAEELRLSAEQLKEYLEQLRPEDFGKFKL